MTADYADLCPDHWHCCVTLAAHNCEQPNRLQPCPTCGETPPSLMQQAADDGTTKRLALLIQFVRLAGLYKDQLPGVLQGPLAGALEAIRFDVPCPKCKHIGSHGAECQWL